MIPSFFLVWLFADVVDCSADTESAVLKASASGSIDGCLKKKDNV